ncbi:MAG: transglutaminase family protein [Caulobacter sp.]|nr:transglutaminase family protein [Caulobacter sp.]
MKIRAGYRITFDSVAPTPINFLLSVHPDRRGDLITPDVFTPSVDCPVETFVDSFGNLMSRVLAPPGPVTFSSQFLIEDSGLPEPAAPDARQMAIEDLPGEALQFLLASRYCETDEMSDLAWSLFGGTEPGWKRVEAIVDWTHRRLAYDYKRARPTRTARQGHDEETGVCRDYAHLAVTLCRCMNIPARYCTGYLGDIGVPPLPTPMDFHAWFEVYLGGAWHTFDARHNQRRIGRILMARGRDAADVAISTTFGTTWLTEFSVVTQEVDEAELLLAAE